MIEFGGSSVWSLTSLWLNECNSLTKRNFLFRIHRTDGRTDMKTTVIQQFRDQINMILMISSHEELHLPSLNGPSSVSFSFIFVLSNKHYNFYNKFEKMSIQYLVLWFEHTTFRLWVSSLNHLTRAPARTYLSYISRIYCTWEVSCTYLHTKWCIIEICLPHT